MLFDLLIPHFMDVWSYCFGTFCGFLNKIIHKLHDFTVNIIKKACTRAQNNETNQHLQADFFRFSDFSLLATNGLTHLHFTFQFFNMLIVFMKWRTNGILQEKKKRKVYLTQKGKKRRFVPLAIGLIPMVIPLKLFQITTNFWNPIPSCDAGGCLCSPGADKG